MNKRKIGITLGDFNGIGPEIVVKALNHLHLPKKDFVIIGSSALLKDLDIEHDIVDVSFSDKDIQLGEETKQAGEFSYQCLVKACELAKNGEINAIVTAPVSKNALHLAGHYYSGQTEILEKFLSNNITKEKAEMLFVSGDFRVLLLTRHVALKDVKITKDLLIEKITRINNVLKEHFYVQNPNIALCSLNPHSGENGILGMEEIEEFAPAIENLRLQNIVLSNPMPSDTLFVKAAKAYNTGKKQPYDVYCACYHDQVLIPIKVLAMDKAVNMTVGLPVLRTSPAHGTAYDIAGKGIADYTSMVCAIKELL